MTIFSPLLMYVYIMCVMEYLSFIFNNICHSKKMNEHSVKMIYVLLIPAAVSHLLLISLQAIGYGNVTYIRAYIHTYMHKYAH